MKKYKSLFLLLISLISINSFAQKNEIKVMYSPLSLVLINRDNEIEDAFTSKETEVNFFFHAEVVNFTWGKTHGLTGQLGYGHKGLVSVGYFVRW